MRAQKLKEILKKKYGTRSAEKAAKELGIDPSTFYRKLNNNGDDFTIEQMRRIIAITEMSEDEAVDIFFTDELADTQESA